MRFLLASIIFVCVISGLLGLSLNAQDRDRMTEELIPELQPLSWMIGQWQPDEIFMTSNGQDKWVWYNDGHLRKRNSDLRMLSPVDVRKSDDGQRLVTTYTYSTKGRETQVNEVISWDATTQKVKWNCRFDWVEGGNREAGVKDALLELKQDGWIVESSATKIRISLPQYSVFERTLDAPESGTIYVVVKSKQLNIANLKPELQSLAWMVGDWRTAELPSQSKDYYSYYLAGDGMQVQPSVDGGSLQIKYYYCIELGMLWGTESDVVETVFWDSEKKRYRVVTSIETYSRQNNKSVRTEKIYYLIPAEESSPQDSNDELANIIRIQRTDIGLCRTGFAENNEQKPFSHPKLGDRLTVDFSKLE